MIEDIAPRPRRPPLVAVKPDCTLVLMGASNRPHVEVRPHYETSTGPTLVLYRVDVIGDPQYLATITLPVLGALIQKLPIAISAARRLHANATRPGRNGATEPIVKRDSSPA